MRIVLFCFAFVFLVARPESQARNLPAGVVTPQLVINTRNGPVYKAVGFAPKPVVPVAAQPRNVCHGVYIIDIDPSVGRSEGARVLQSSGSKALDDIAVAALAKWIFRPRSVYKAIVPIEFGPGQTKIGG